ncbi:hypothetical protein AWM75_00965 [Aerococcus urinaehominis]|uniref:Uncharacterized protein n=1 Tax=Aerococcus urinaehominis TaxID=128944 RepID=A0A109RHI9_9LACT|nr:MarR family winged helix-turn-helix transcriptional regulator [Aerococcus urinaehominis]AMB98650.1 hypothetical protein AWM75_00965 [Aerococcus urinaehominis]SDL96964.1 DNA-binding transcriptional regulator, MarR family [Aerococcus urinaehominis]
MKAFSNQPLGKLLALRHLNIEFIQHQLKNHDINPMQAHAIYFIKEHPYCQQKTLAGFLGKPNSTTANLISALEKKGYLSRQTASDNDRSKELFLTDSGQAMATQLSQTFDALNQRLIANLTDQDISLFSRLVDQMINNQIEKE